MGKIVISNAKRSLTVNGASVSLPTKAFNLLYYLAINKGEFKSREQIISDCWDTDYVTERTVDVHITKIRKAIGSEAIKNEIKVGYMLNVDVEIDDDLSDYEAHELADGINMGTYKGNNKNMVVVIAVAESKYGNMVVFVSGSKYHTMPVKEFTNSFKFVR